MPTRKPKVQFIAQRIPRRLSKLPHHIYMHSKFMLAWLNGSNLTNRSVARWHTQAAEALAAALLADIFLEETYTLQQLSVPRLGWARQSPCIDLSPRRPLFNGAQQ
eukprot:scaffold343786_cov38-Prasinocladus_malaysianus.AAC.1